MVEEIVTTKKYELRELNASDIFSMSRIIKKIGVASFKQCFDNEAVKQMIANMSDEDKASDKGLTSIGITVAFEVADVIFARLPECESELYAFLASVSGLPVAEVKALSMADFFEMVIEIIKKPEFKDFFKVASKLFK